MELSKNFEPGAVEEKWYSHWVAKNYFGSKPDDREAYTIVMPPPNVTGVLHMGHALNNTIQDILIRHARMQGKNACWVPGTDHASIATEAKVVAMLRERGITKSSLSREAFLDYAWEWKEKYGGIILQQLKKLGCSLDWDRTSFTMDPHYYASVMKVFVDLHNKGIIYRGKRMINWDVSALTALSDEEVIRKETQQKLYYIRYKIDSGEGLTDDEGNDAITIATVRPETIMGDAAICVNPNDERYKHLHGKYAVVPLINRRIPIIADEYVTIDFGTGALKVTPAHDVNDYMLGQKFQLEVIDVFNDDGTLSEAAQIFVGEERFAARKKIAATLEEKGFIEKIETYKSEVGYSERTDTVVEPRLSMQWWVSMPKLAAPALEAVIPNVQTDDNAAAIQFVPAKFKNVYRHWMENIRDWCISRQLWWGHRIPAWYDADGNIYVAETEAAAFAQALAKNPAIDTATLKQDEDCLDTWFSSWLWPFEVFRGLSNPGNPDIKYYYPTQTLVTAPEIIFFWVARMVMSGFEYMEQKPFEAVYFTGIVRDKQGRKMSKSLGNSPDLLALIEQYGADATRFGVMIASPAGNDILFDESALEQGRNFNNKMWNALKLIKLWEARQSDIEVAGGTETFAMAWFECRLAQVSAEVALLMGQFKLSEALKVLYTLVWDDFCSWYLEWIKPGMEQPIPTAVYQKTIEFFNAQLLLLHPFIPFVTEEIFHQLLATDEDLCTMQLSTPLRPDEEMLAKGSLLKTVISGLRDVRNRQNIKPKDSIVLGITTDDEKLFKSISHLLAKQINAASISFTKDPVPGATAAIINKNSFYITSDQPVDLANQKATMEKELTHLKGFLLSVEKKLANDKFVQNAKPEVLAAEKKKQADAHQKINLLSESLAML